MDNPTYQKLLSLANEALYDAYESYPALGVGVAASKEQAAVVIEALWPITEIHNMGTSNTMADIVTAAQNWVERIVSHPNYWADEEDFALIEAVRSHVPGVRCQWTENPEYAGWTEAWHE